MEHPTCFISYSWDSNEHRDWVRHLGEVLQANGVYVFLDQWDAQLGMDLPQYMEEKIRECEFVILVCTPIFAEKANKGKGGVGYEKSIVTGEIFSGSSSNKKYIPVIRKGSSEASLPSYLKSKLYVDITSDQHYQSGVEEILRHMHNEPSVKRPPLGLKPSFSQKHIDTSRVADLTKHSASQKQENISSLKPQSTKQFDLDYFKQLKDYAYSSGGLNMNDSGAIRWAEARLKDEPPFNLERFKQLKAYAYSGDGLNMNDSGAIRWAEARLKDEPPFNLERFKQLRAYAYSGGGLNMNDSGAIRWAEARLKDEPPFDLERFKQLKAYAYSGDGLNMNASSAIQWAMSRMQDDHKRKNGDGSI